MSKSQKQRERQRAYVDSTLHEWHTEREATPPTSTPANPFDNYDSIRTPEAAEWDERGYMRWQLPLNSPSGSWS